MDKNPPSKDEAERRKPEDRPKAGKDGGQVEPAAALVPETLPEPEKIDRQNDLA